jgi:hypothetical protein
MLQQSNVVPQALHTHALFSTLAFSRTHAHRLSNTQARMHMFKYAHMSCSGEPTGSCLGLGNPEQQKSQRVPSFNPDTF